MEKTEKLGLNLPEKGYKDWDIPINENFEILDSKVAEVDKAIDAKQATITGGASTITSTNLTASRALVSNESGKVAVSAVTDTELGYLAGITSSIQTQLNAKAPSGAINWIPNYSSRATVSLPYTTPSNGFFNFKCRGGSSGGAIHFDGVQVFSGGGGAAATFTWVYAVKKGVQITGSGNQISNFAFIPCS